MDLNKLRSAVESGDTSNQGSPFAKIVTKRTAVEEIEFLKAEIAEMERQLEAVSRDENPFGEFKVDDEDSAQGLTPEGMLTKKVELTKLRLVVARGRLEKFTKLEQGN